VIFDPHRSLGNFDKLEVEIGQNPAPRGVSFELFLYLSLEPLGFRGGLLGEDGFTADRPVSGGLLKAFQGEVKMIQ